jgi:hypothetical protein
MSFVFLLKDVAGFKKKALSVVALWFIDIPMTFLKFLGTSLHLFNYNNDFSILSTNLSLGVGTVLVPLVVISLLSGAVTLSVLFVRWTDGVFNKKRRAFLRDSLVRLSALMALYLAYFGLMISWQWY